jgi:DNA-binding beta-propeller fold protein YncE
MNTKLKYALVLAVVMLSAAFSVHGLIPDDADGDGVPDSVDVCPGEDASSFDRDGDGCIDAFIGARHIEYWSVEDAVIGYVINDQGAPNISNGSDLTAVQDAVDSWINIADTDLNVVFDGTTTQTNSNGLDRINLVTFVDNAYPFSQLVLAVGLSTSFEADTLIDGRVFSKGEIFDADMVFNPAHTFTVGGSTTSTDIQSVATHEAGHLFGISHSAIQSSTMFYVLPAGTAARSLETDDELVFFKAYGTETELAAANRLDVLVTNGQTSDPVAGAIVFVTDAGSGDPVGCDYTLENGQATFPGLATGSYYVFIHPLNGTAPIGFIGPANINILVYEIATENFVPESYDGAESNVDDPSARTPVTVGSAPVSIEIETNIDATAPTVISAAPADNATDVAIDGAYRVKFSEAVDVSTISAAFSFRDDAGGTPHGGSIAVLTDDSVMVFIPSPPLAFSTDYTFRLDTDLHDQFGNPLASDFALNVTTEPEPPISISSLAPSKGVAGTTMVISGQGFEAGATVDFAGVPGTVVSMTDKRIVTSIPGGAASGTVVVTNPDLTASNSLSFTVLTQAEVARGTETGQVQFGSRPNAIALTPDGAYAYVATEDGAQAIVVEPTQTGYLLPTPIPFPQGFDDVAATPSGTRVYAVSEGANTFVEINSDPTTGLLFNTILSTRPMSASPRGIVIDPAGDRAYVATDESEVQEWDIRLDSPTYRQQVGAVVPPGGSGVTGAMAMTPSGHRLLFAAEDGNLYFYDPTADAIVATVAVGFGARGVVVDPPGARAYVTHDDGDVSIVNLVGNPFEVQDVETGGSLRGIAITPGASYLYPADRALDNLKVIDLVETNSTFRSVVAEIPAVDDPVDVALSPDGFYAFSLLQGDAGIVGPMMLVTTIGAGPTLTHIHPIAGPPGTIVTLSGIAFGESPSDIAVNFNGIVIPDAGSGLSGFVSVAVPASATSGPVTISVEQLDGSTLLSNPLAFEVLGPSSGSLRFAATLDPNTSTGEQMADDIAMSPKGDMVYARFFGGTVRAYDIRPGSTTFHKAVRVFSPAAEVYDLAVTADGKTCFFGGFNTAAGTIVSAFVSDPSDPDFCKLRPFQLVEFAAGQTYVFPSPDNELLFIYDNEISDLTLYDASNASQDVEPQAIAGVSLAGSFRHLVFHPSGYSAYVVLGNPSGVQIIDTDARNPTFGTAVDFHALGTTASPLTSSHGVTPDGGNLFVYTIDTSTRSDVREIYAFGILDAMTGKGFTGPIVTTHGAELPVSFTPRDLRISPRGDRAIRSSQAGYFLYDVSTPATLILPTLGTGENSSYNDFAFAPDGSRLYTTSESFDHVLAYDFATAAEIVAVSGDNQTGVAGDVLAAPIRVRVVEIVGGGVPQGTPGVPVTFLAGGGMGLFEIPCNGGGTCLVNEIIVATDDNGFAQANWWMGAVGTLNVEAVADGVPGSPVVFTATGVADPTSLPLTVAEVIPLNTSVDISVSTAALVTFSRPVDASTIDATSLFMQSAADATLVPVVFGFTNNDSKVSLIPINPLTPLTDYEIVTTAGIQATSSGGALTNPGTSTFATQAPPPLTITSISPPSALPGSPVTIAGTGFGPVNTVNFGASAANGVGNSIMLSGTIPNNAATGIVNVTVSSGGVESNALPFNILAASTTVIDDVIANVSTGQSAKSIIVSGDGAFCYTVSTEGDVVIPVDVAGLTTLPSIPVGDQPVAIVIDPAGDFAYVANFNSGSVSAIDVNDSPLPFHTVEHTIQVGSNPLDVAMTPDGSQLVVANAGSQSVSMVDIDETSATYNQVVSNVSVGQSAKSVIVSGDGTIYVGTDTGVVIIDASNQVVGNVSTGQSSKSIIVSGDGTLLFVLTEDSNVLIVDIQDGSPSENQVVANVGAGQSAKSLIISADGTLLYIVQEATDEVLVLAIDIIPGVGVTNPDGVAPFTVQTRLVATLETGDDPADIAVDPFGSGRVFVVNAGDKTLTIYGKPLVAIEGIFNIVPGIIIPKLPGFYVLGVIQLVPPLSVHDIDIATVRVFDTVHVADGKYIIADVNHDGVDDLSVLFCRDEFLAAMPENGEFVDVVCKGEVGGEEFEGDDTIRVLRPTITKPEENEHVSNGQPYEITWTTPLQILPCDKVKIEWRQNGDDEDDIDCDFHGDDDDGFDQSAASEMDEVQRLNEPAEMVDDDWILIANHVPNDGNYTWDVPAGYYPNARLRITLLWFGFKVGSSEVPFMIDMTVPVRLKSFDVTMEDGTAVLRWETTLEVGMQGYEVVRSIEERGRYDEITDDMVRSSGSVSGGSYEYRDESVTANQTYWYKLREVADDGLGAEYGPYSVVFRLTNQLDQNVPNPFNPTTTIRYAIAGENAVNLTIYDVAGRKVRTLVNERQRADVYKIVWDGVNDAGVRAASGVYFYKLVAGKFTQTKKMVLLK